MIGTEKMVIRPKISSTDEDPVGKALASHGMSKFAGCPDYYIGASYDRTLGRYLTGLDENHPDILRLPQEERIAKQAEILENRKYLEQELGVNLHHTNEEYWSTLPIILDRGKMYNPSIPKEKVIMGAIIAGKMIPTNKDDIGNPDYLGGAFYAGGEFEDVKEKSADRQKGRDVTNKLTALLGKFEFAIEVATYLNIHGVSDKMPLINLDDVLSDWLEKKGNAETFLETMAESEAFIRLSNKFKEFRNKGLVKYEDGRWLSGKVKLGKTERESVKKLLGTNPEMQAELANLMENYLDSSKT